MGHKQQRAGSTLRTSHPRHTTQPSSVRLSCTRAHDDTSRRRLGICTESVAVAGKSASSQAAEAGSLADSLNFLYYHELPPTAGASRWKATRPTIPYPWCQRWGGCGTSPCSRRVRDAAVRAGKVFVSYQRSAASEPTLYIFRFCVWCSTQCTRQQQSRRFVVLYSPLSHLFRR